MNGAPTELPPPQWRPLARLVLFLLGVAVVIDALVKAGNNVGQLLVGALLVGIIPVDELMARVGRRNGARPD